MKKSQSTFWRQKKAEPWRTVLSAFFGKVVRTADLDVLQKIDLEEVYIREGTRNSRLILLLLDAVNSHHTHTSRVPDKLSRGQEYTSENLVISTLRRLSLDYIYPCFEHLVRVPHRVGDSFFSKVQPIGMKSNSGFLNTWEETQHRNCHLHFWEMSTAEEIID